MAKDSIEQVQLKNPETELAEVFPLDAEDASSLAELVETVTEQDEQQHSKNRNDNPLEPTIVPEPIGTGATVDIVTADTAVEIDHDQYSEVQTDTKPAEEIQQ